MWRSEGTELMERLSGELLMMKVERKMGKGRWDLENTVRMIRLEGKVDRWLEMNKRVTGLWDLGVVEVKRIPEI